MNYGPTGDAEYSKIHHKRKECKNGAFAANLTPSQLPPGFVADSSVVSKHDEYLLRLEEKTRMKKQLEKENEEDKLRHEKEKGFQLYLNGANTSRFDGQTAVKGLRKSHHHPNSKKWNRESGSDNVGHRARTAPPKRKKWTQDGDVEILTHRDGKLKFGESYYQYKYSEDFTDSGEEDLVDSGVQIGEDDCFDSMQYYEEDDSVEEVSFDRKEVELLRQSLKLDEILRESVQECLMDETPSDSETSQTTSSTAVIDFGLKLQGEKKQPKILKTGGSSGCRSYTPTGRFENPPCLANSAETSQRSTLSYGKSNATSKSEENDPAKIFSVEIPDNDTEVREVVEKFRRLGVDQKRVLLEALTRETSDVSKGAQSSRPTCSFDFGGPKDDIHDLLMSSSSPQVNKSVASIAVIPVQSESRESVKTYRVDGQSIQDDKVSLHQLMQSQSSIFLETDKDIQIPPNDSASVRSETPNSGRPKSSSRVSKFARGDAKSTADSFLEFGMSFGGSAVKTSKVICLKLISNWGDSEHIGLTGVRFIDSHDKVLKCDKFSVINAVD